VDVVGRYGGEEIVALLPDADIEQARLAGERLRAAMPSLGVLLPGAHTITASVGVAVYDPGDPVDIETLIDRADRAQYRAKNSGKNRVVVWSGAPPPPEDSSPSTLKVR
jgi:diguanylate cyclase (GGDEF)-like protein